MFGQGLHQLQKTLTSRADAIQHEFIEISERLAKLARNLVEAQEAGEKEAIMAEQDQLRQRRAEIAEEVNVWRDRAKAVINQPGDEALLAYLKELSEAVPDDQGIQDAIQYVRFLMNATEEELAALMRPKEVEKPLTPAGRLIERARREWDLRQDDPAPRQKAAIEFANRPGMAQDEAALAEIEEAIYDPDKFVREVTLLTLIQLHRLRALRLADLDAAYQSVLSLTKINHPQVVPALAAVLENARSGFTRPPGAQEPVEQTNTHLRVAAIKRLVEWHTPEARRAVEARQLDRDEQVSYIARRALETFPNEWNKPIRGTGIMR